MLQLAKEKLKHTRTRTKVITNTEMNVQMGQS